MRVKVISISAPINFKGKRVQVFKFKAYSDSHSDPFYAPSYMLLEETDPISKYMVSNIYEDKIVNENTMIFEEVLYNNQKIYMWMKGELSANLEKHDKYNPYSVDFWDCDFRFHSKSPSVFYAKFIISKIIESLGINKYRDVHQTINKIGNLIRFENSPNIKMKYRLNIALLYYISNEYELSVRILSESVDETPVSISNGIEGLLIKCINYLHISHSKIELNFSDPFRYLDKNLVVYAQSLHKLFGEGNNDYEPVDSLIFKIKKNNNELILLTEEWVANDYQISKLNNQMEIFMYNELMYNSNLKANINGYLYFQVDFLRINYLPVVISHFECKGFSFSEITNLISMLNE